MRTALVGQQTICFSSRKLSGPAPGVGRVIERVERDGREFEFTWDDGLVLHTSLRRSGSWDLYRVGDRWRRKHSDAAALIESEDWVAVCFDAAEVETYRREPIDRHPSRGRVGPDLSDPTSIVKSSLKQFFITQIRRREFVKHCSIHALFEVSATCMRRRRSGRRV